MSAPKSYHCPCGCGTVLAVGQTGKRPVMCKAAWASLPATIRRDITSPSLLPEYKRTAFRRAFDLLKQREQKRIEGRQLKLGI